MSRRSRRRRGLVPVVAALCAATCGAAGSAHAAIPTPNLLQNPGAETLGGNDPVGEFPPPMWDSSNGFIVEKYDAPNRPSAAVGNSIGGGTYNFAGGSAANQSSTSQIVDVSSEAADIDAGRVLILLRGFFGGIDNEGDYAQAAVDYERSGAFVEFAPPTAPVTAADRGNQTGFVPRSTTARVPVGTRRLRVRITSTRVFGTYTDGYADNLSLVLNRDSAATNPPASKLPGSRPNRRTTRKGKLSGIKSPGRRVKGRLSVKSPCKNGRRVVVTKGSKVLGKTKSKAGGRFNIKTKKHKKGKLTVKVRKRVVGNTVCARLSKRVPGRN